MILGLVAGCAASVDPERPAASALPEHRRVDLDPATGQIALPVDRYFISEVDFEAVLNAHAMAVSRCAADRGVDLPFRPVIPEVGGSRQFGVWVESMAAEWGYAVPQSREKAEAIERNSDAAYALTDAQVAAAEACADVPDVARFIYDPSLPALVGEEVGTAEREALASDAARVVFDEWEQCLNQNGLRRDLSDGPFGVLGATLEVSEANIRIALTDVRCKDDVDFVARLAQIEADRMAPVLDRYASELEQLGVEKDALAGQAREYLAAHG